MSTAQVYEIFDPRSPMDGAVIAVMAETFEFPLYLEETLAVQTVPADGDAKPVRRAVPYVPTFHITNRGHTQLVRSTEHEDKYL